MMTCIRFAGIGQDFEHGIEAIVVGEDQGVVQDERSGLALLDQEIGERDPGQYASCSCVPLLSSSAASS